MYRPGWLFDGVVADVVEWDGKLHTVRCEVREGCVFMKYCDGVVHCVTLEYFVDVLHAEPHRFSWTHYFTGGGSKSYELPYFHAVGCGCAQ